MEYLLVNVKDTWRIVIKKQMSEPYFQKIITTLDLGNALNNNESCPEPSSIFEAFTYFDVPDTKIVIIGQDPYIYPEQAMGLAFSVPSGVQLPPSLKNIYKEIDRSIGYPNGTIPSNGFLGHWAEQGVLLLNSALTVKPRVKNSHKKIWEKFTEAIIKEINENASDVVFCLWGKQAENKSSLIDQDRHHVLITSHPSPFSAPKGFYGCDHFNKANELLERGGREGINWTLLN